MTKQPTDEQILDLQHDLERLRMDMQVHKYQLGRIQGAAQKLGKAIQLVAVQKAKQA